MEFLHQLILQIIIKGGRDWQLEARFGEAASPSFFWDSRLLGTVVSCVGYTDVHIYMYAYSVQ